uniref:Uncharacterized protein n=1 Tax=Globodera rostochiensis TaxID=31243 RepID=A0A914IE64_GLORO
MGSPGTDWDYLNNVVSKSTNLLQSSDIAAKGLDVGAINHNKSSKSANNSKPKTPPPKLHNFMEGNLNPPTQYNLFPESTKYEEHLSKTGM